MKTISIYLGIRNLHWYFQNCALIRVSDPKEIKLINKTCTGFKCVRHTIFGPFVNDHLYELKFLIPSEKSECYNTLTFLNNGSTEGEDMIECKSGSIEVYVYFYGEDPRPLMFCYGKQAYIPKDKGEYESKWEKVKNGITNCVCDDKGDNEPLLKALTTVVGFLNQVELQMHPNSKSNAECNNSPSVAPSTCDTPATEKNTSNTCRYDVHKYKGRDVKVSVKCEALNGNKSGNGSCYKKLTHTPAGLNGAGGNGFRLGNVVYNGTGVKGSIKYYDKNGRNNNWSTHWCKPLVKVEAYFYDGDTNYRDPLLVVLEFKKNGDGGANDKECYKLTKTLNGSGGNIKWEKDSDACEKVEKNGDELIKHLDCIKYNLKKVLKVEIDKQNGYGIQVSEKPGGTGTEFGPLTNGKDKKIEVKDCTTGVCSKLSGTNYKCFQHRISELSADVLYKIGGVAFTMPGTSYSPENEIKLFNRASNANCKNKKTYIQVKPLTYNKCMGDICVYFYYRDPRPLLLCYNGNFYAPRCMEEYYSKWVKVENCNVKKCECARGSCDGCDNLLTALVNVSNFLNPVNIKKIPNNNEKPICCYEVDKFNGRPITIQVKLTTPSNKSFCYNRYTHTHFGTGKGDGSGFRLGNIEYDNNCIKENTSGPNNGKCITSQLVNESTPDKYKSADKVVVFYYQGDKQFERPLLVALCKSSSNDNCDVYYELQKSSSSAGAKLYKKGDKTPIDLSNTSATGTLDTILDRILSENNYKLQIILDRIPMPKLYCPSKPDGNKEYKHPFKCEERQNASKGTAAKTDSNEKFIPPSYEAQLYESNGNPLQNGTTHKTVKVSQVDCWQLTTYGYRCYEHQIKDLPGVEEIGGLKFYLWDNTGGVCG